MPCAATVSCRESMLIRRSISAYMHSRSGRGGKPHIESVHINIEESIMRGLKEETRQLCTKLLSEKEPLQIVNEHLIPALDAVGARYEKKEIYLPQLINAATASQCALKRYAAPCRQADWNPYPKGKSSWQRSRGMSMISERISSRLFWRITAIRYLIWERMYRWRLWWKPLLRNRYV